MLAVQQTSRFWTQTAQNNVNNFLSLTNCQCLRLLQKCNYHQSFNISLSITHTHATKVNLVTQAVTLYEITLYISLLLSK